MVMVWLAVVLLFPFDAVPAKKPMIAMKGEMVCDTDDSGIYNDGGGTFSVSTTGEMKIHLEGLIPNLDYTCSLICRFINGNSGGHVLCPSDAQGVIDVDILADAYNFPSMAQTCPGIELQVYYYDAARNLILSPCLTGYDNRHD
jgi:hypothetical protein